MNGNGNKILTLIEKLYFSILPSSGARTQYINKHKNKFKHIGNDLFFQPRNFPADPELLSIGNNVKIASNVIFINHDVINSMLNKCKLEQHFDEVLGCIMIGDNVMIGANSMILPNVKIGSNVIIGAGSIVTKDIPDNTVAAGVPCRVVGTFEAFYKKRSISSIRKEELWNRFYEER